MFTVNDMMQATHDFFREEGFLYLQSPLITASDCEGAGEMFRVTTLPSKVCFADGNCHARTIVMDTGNEVDCNVIYCRIPRVMYTQDTIPG